LLPAAVLRLEETGFFVAGFVADFADGALPGPLVDADAADAFEDACVADTGLAGAFFTLGWSVAVDG
jgi:hypothetical protein